MSCDGFFHVGHKEFRNLVTRDYTIAVNKTTVDREPVMLPRNMGVPMEEKLASTKA
jgi:hypothetical protein